MSTLSGLGGPDCVDDLPAAAAVGSTGTARTLSEPSKACQGDLRDSTRDSDAWIHCWPAHREIGPRQHARGTKERCKTVLDSPDSPRSRVPDQRRSVRVRPPSSV